MKDKLARMDIEVIRVEMEGLRREVRQDYTIQSERLGKLRRDHQRLIGHLGLESKHTPETVKYVKRRKKNG